MTTESIPAELLVIREKIDQIDHKLVLLLANRFALTTEVGQLKAHHGMQAYDPHRENGKLAEIRGYCTTHNVSPDLVTDILARIMREVVKNHKLIKGNGA